jgi:hypothetical protein
MTMVPSKPEEKKPEEEGEEQEEALIEDIINI